MGQSRRGCSDWVSVLILDSRDVLIPPSGGN